MQAIGFKGEVLLILGLAACADAVDLPTDAAAPRDASSADAGRLIDGGLDGGVILDANPTEKDAGGVRPDAGTSSPACSVDMTQALQDLQVPGLAAGVVAEGRVVCVGVAGDADREGRRKVSPDTIFAWASVSKAVTAVAMMILVDRGLVDLDDDVNQHLPFAVINPQCAAQTPTVRQLMTHVSSIIDAAVYDTLYTNTGDSNIVLGEFLEDYLTPAGQYYDAEDNFDYECPGLYAEYSNVAVALLGHLVAEISGRPFDDFCREEIFEPLGMGPSSFFFSALDPDDVAMPYTRMVDGSFTPYGHVGLPTYPDGSLRSSVPSMARFLLMLANDGALDGVRILSASSAQLMRTPQIPQLDPAQGLILFTESFGAHAGVIGHDGSDPGTSALMFFDPATGGGALLVANGDWYEPNDGAEASALLAALLDLAAGS